MTGNGTDQFDQEYSEQFLPYWRKKLGLGPNDGVIIESAKDVRDVLKHYYQFLNARITKVEAPEQQYIELCNLPIPLGFTMIWGAPDYLKTHIGCALAREAHECGLRVAYVDAENKLEKRMLPKGIYYIPGTAATPQIVRKLAVNNSFDFYVFDTIYAMSNYENTLHSLVKHGRPNGVRYILINQTSVDFATHKKIPAGADTIKAFVTSSIRVVKKSSTERMTFAKLETGHHFFFDVQDRQLVYNKAQSRFLEAVNNAEIVKLGKEYKFAGRMVKKADIIAEWQQQHERLATSLRIISSENLASPRPEDQEPSAETPISMEPDLP